MRSNRHRHLEGWTWPQPRRRKSRWTAYLIWLVAGAFGGHRFYLGKPGSATAQAVLWAAGLTLHWTSPAGLVLIAIAASWALIDVVSIARLVTDYNALLAAETTE